MSQENATKALAWARKESFPWPHVFKQDIDQSWNFMQYRNEFVPQYILVDSDGVKIIEGFPEILTHLSKIGVVDVDKNEQ